MEAAGMNTRERLKCIFAHKKPDRLPIIEWATWWDKTVRRWENEGLPKGLNEFEIRNFFKQDPWRQYWLPLMKPGAPRPAYHGAPLIANEKEYEDLYPFLYPDADCSFFRACQNEHQSGELAVWITLEGFFWVPRKLLGIEPHLTSFYDSPELYHRICNDLLRWMERSIDALLEILTPDFMTFAEDMSYNHGPMVGKSLFDEFLAPYYRSIVPKLKNANIPVILDSDGDISACLGWYMGTGMNGILPLERQAGVDIARLREMYPEAVFIGAFDKMALNQGEDAIRAEFERLLPTAQKGGALLSVDHQTPPGVSLKQYERYMELYREYAEKAVTTSV
jgi:hypothetical protein